MLVSKRASRTAVTWRWQPAACSDFFMSSQLSTTCRTYSSAVDLVGLNVKFKCRTTAAALISGFFASACSLPFDFVKTRIQKMKPDASGKMPYSSMADCAMKVCSMLHYQNGPACMIGCNVVNSKIASYLLHTYNLYRCANIQQTCVQLHAIPRIMPNLHNSDLATCTLGILHAQHS
jgi:hypothetical protein